MTQLAKPIADVSNNGWTQTPPPLYAQIQTIDDATFVTSPADPNGNTFVVKLTPLTWPINRLVGNLTVRLRKTNSDDINVYAYLMQGNSMLSQSDAIKPGVSFDTITLHLDSSKLQLITDYSDLRVRIQAGGQPGVAVPCWPDPVPTTLYATLNEVVQCPCIHNLSIPLIYNAASEKWEGSAQSPCAAGGIITLKFGCTTSGTICPPGPYWQLQAYCNGIFTGAGCAASQQPFSFNYLLPLDAPPNSPCCGLFTSAVTVVVTT